jgi:hypothetical protein
LYNPAKIGFLFFPSSCGTVRKPKNEKNNADLTMPLRKLSNAERWQAIGLIKSWNNAQEG